MPQLRNLISEQQRQELALEQLIPGRMLHMEYDFADPSPKNKFMLLLCWEPDPLFFLINSQIHALMQQTQQHIDCQVPLKASDYSFLSCNSFINCYQLESKIERKTVLARLAMGTGEFKDILNSTDAENVLAAVTDVQSINEDARGQIIGALRSQYPQDNYETAEEDIHDSPQDERTANQE